MNYRYWYNKRTFSHNGWKTAELDWTLKADILLVNLRRHRKAFYKPEGGTLPTDLHCVLSTATATRSPPKGVVSGPLFSRMYRYDLFLVIDEGNLHSPIWAALF